MSLEGWFQLRLEVVIQQLVALSFLHRTGHR